VGEVESDFGRAATQRLPSMACLRCGGIDTFRLEKARSQANTCFRCRGCGHIFSPIGD